MNIIYNFLTIHYENAVKLNLDFNITREQEWTPLLILNELSIQIGHVNNILYQSEAVNEKNRTFSNLGDELSDVILQLIALAYSLNVNLFDINQIKPLEESNWMAFPILIGQLTEAIMEKYGFRFTKPRANFDTIDDFIKNRILRLFDITFQIAQRYNLDMVTKFDLMLQDANQFLQNFSRKKYQNKPQ